jgi:hypothetical protein
MKMRPIVASWLVFAVLVPPFVGRTGPWGRGTSNIISTYISRHMTSYHALALHYTCVRLKDLNVGVHSARGSSIARLLERYSMQPTKSFDEIADSRLAFISYIFFQHGTQRGCSWHHSALRARGPSLNASSISPYFLTSLNLHSPDLFFSKCSTAELRAARHTCPLEPY